MQVFNTVFFQDNLQGLKIYPDNEFDIAIIDPQYGINATKMDMGSNPNRSKSDGHRSGPSTSTTVKLKGRLNSGGGGKLKNRILNQSEIDWDNEIPSPEFFNELFRVSKHQIIFGGNYFPLPPTRGIIAWDKCQPWENFSQFELIWTSFDFPAKLYRISNTGGNNQEKKIHETQKPIKLYDRIMKDFVKPGMKILDTHVGSGSSRISAYKANVDFVGFENKQHHWLSQEKRFKEFKKLYDLQPQLIFQ